MKRLVLIRHGQAVPHDSGVRDFARKLDMDGEHEARISGQFLKSETDWIPNLLVTSPAARALATAKLLAGENGIEESSLVKEPTIYEASVSDLARVIQKLDETVQCFWLVGHNPGFEDFGCWLAGKSIVRNLATAGVLLLELDIMEWSEIEHGCGGLRRYFRPR